MKSIYHLILSMILTLPSVTIAQETLSGDRPIFRVGDQWVKGRTDLWKNKHVGSTEAEVVSVHNDHIEYKVTSSKGQGSEKKTTDLSGNTITTGNRVNAPYYPMLEFPLSVGKKWSRKYQWKSSTGEGSGVNNMEVLGVESVSVQAGTFDAFKITYRGTYTAKGQSGTATNKAVYWYAPAAKTVVRIEYSSTKTNGDPHHMRVDELESYSLAQ